MPGFSGLKDDKGERGLCTGDCQGGGVGQKVSLFTKCYDYISIKTIHRGTKFYLFQK